MKMLLCGLVCLLMAGCVHTEQKADDWAMLYNGKGLDAWQETKGNWIELDEGILEIHPRKGESGWSRYGSYLFTKKTYKDFVLHVEYNYPKGGNSGVYFRIGDMKDPTEFGIEAQILDSSGKKEGSKMSHHDHGGIIRTVGASKNMSKKPGEWNRMIITAKGKQIKVELNGEQIVDVDVTGTTVDNRPLEGYIALQDHGEPHNIKFRNIKIKEL